MATITETVRRPKVQQTQCFIGGKWTSSASGKTFETIHPATEEVICEVAEGDKEDVDAAVDAARDAFENGPWATMDARDRGALMYKLADVIEEEADELGCDGLGHRGHHQLLRNRRDRRSGDLLCKKC